MSHTELDAISMEILALETETFEVSDYADVTEAVLAGSTSCTSSTTSSTSCGSSCSSTSCCSSCSCSG